MKKITILMATMAIMLPLTACKKDETKGAGQMPPAPVVDVIEIQKMPYSNSYEFSGFTSAEDTVAIMARVSGYIMERKFTEGDYVKKGQKLFLIEPDSYEANLKSAQGTVIAAKATLEKTGLDLLRAEELLKGGNTSKSMYDTAKSNFDNARAGLMQAQAALQVAELNVKYTNVEAPISGKISLSNYDKGNLVGPESGVLTTIVNSNPINVEIGISEEFLIQFGQYLASPYERKKIKVKMTLRDGSVYDEEGEIETFDVLLNRSTNTVTAKVKFPNSEGHILPGQYALLTIIEPVPTDRAIIPQSAATVTQGNYFVMVVDKAGKLSSKQINVGQQVDGNYIVNSGLEDGDLVVINNLQKIRPGMTLKYKKVDLNATEEKDISEQSALEGE